MGEKSIAIVPKRPPKGVIPERITDKTPFYADSIDPIENTFSRLSDIGDKLDATVDQVRAWFNQNEAKLSASISSFASAMAQINQLTTSINQDGIVSQIKQASVALSDSLNQVNSALTKMNNDKVFDNLGRVASNIEKASVSIDRVCQDLATGQGTFGKLIQADDMYLRMTAILSKADTLMNDINHYGILFHLNKAWQRTRTRRIAQLNALDSASSFKSYFQNEIDQINTSMARISMLIDRAKDDDQKTLLESPSFRDNFAELLREVDEMSDNLRLYNEQYAQSIKP
jgi:phospholipid/cholesterol/gamma-HCH transport system substrate-binding protein